MGSPRGVSVRRAVFDTNVVVSALVFQSRLAWLRQAWKDDCSPVICAETTDELLRVLAYPKFKLTGAAQRVLLDDYLPFAVTIALPEPLPPLPAPCRDRKDAVFLHLALTAACPLVSGDADLTVLRGVATLPILSGAELRSLLYGEPKQDG